MVLNIHSDASYLSEPRAQCHLGGTYFMGILPKDGKPIQINGPIQIHASICKFVVTSAAEAELGALFYNIQEGTILRIALEELGHPQPPSPVHCDNITAVGITNNKVKKQQSQAMEMRFSTSQTMLPSETSTSHSTLARKTWPTTSPSTLKQKTIKRYALGTSKFTTCHKSCHELWRPAR
jgi:hypothetical protein